MIVGIAAHGTDQAKVGGALGDVRKQVRYFEARLAARLDRPWRSQELAPVFAGFVLALEFGELRFRIERVDMRHASAEVNEDDALGCAGEMRRLGSQRIIPTGARFLCPRVCHTRAQVVGSPSTTPP